MYNKRNLHATVVLKTFFLFIFSSTNIYGKYILSAQGSLEMDGTLQWNSFYEISLILMEGKALPTTLEFRIDDGSE